MHVRADVRPLDPFLGAEPQAPNHLFGVHIQVRGACGPHLLTSEHRGDRPYSQVACGFRLRFRQAPIGNPQGLQSHVSGHASQLCGDARVLLPGRGTGYAHTASACAFFTSMEGRVRRC